MLSGERVVLIGIPCLLVTARRRQAVSVVTEPQRAVLHDVCDRLRQLGFQHRLRLFKLEVNLVGV